MGGENGDRKEYDFRGGGVSGGWWERGCNRGQVWGEVMGEGRKEQITRGRSGGKRCKGPRQGVGDRGTGEGLMGEGVKGQDRGGR